MDVEDVSKSEKVALVVVHGVAPHPRYEFQDEVAGDLCTRMNERDGTDTWTIDVINPAHVLHEGEEDPVPTTTRVRRTDDDGPEPAARFFDVIEAYWSPIDKGATNWFLVVLWILRTVFAPFNTVARVQAPVSKQVFDYGFIGGTLVIAFGLFFLSLSELWQSALRILTITGLIEQSSVGQAISILNTNAEVPGGAPVKIVVWVLVGLTGSFLIGQAAAAMLKTWLQRKALLAHPESIWHRVLAIAILTVIGIVLIYGMAIAHFPRGEMGWWGVGFLVVVFLAFQIGRGLLINFIEEFFGDVQIYTTRDENDSRFYGLRDRILDTAVSAIVRAITPEMNGGYDYDRVIVLGHSLGATIATDAITRLRQACEQGAVTEAQFGKIRAFVMLGSSLEKTQYFFDVAGTTPSVSYEEWRRGAYAKLFSSEPDVLMGRAGSRIFWINYWYFQDPICNEVRSYEDVCRNEKGNRHMTLLHPMLHSDYLDDPWFWFSSDDGAHLGAIDVIAPAEAGGC